MSIRIGFVLALLFLTGCPYANPRTEVTYDWTGFRFHNSKDVVVDIDDLEIDPNTKIVKLKRLHIADNASDVRIANVQQIKAQTEQVQAITAMIQQQTQILASMAESVIPWLRPATSTSVTTPWGGVSTGTTPMPTTRPSP